MDRPTLSLAAGLLLFLTPPLRPGLTAQAATPPLPPAGEVVRWIEGPGWSKGTVVEATDEGLMVTRASDGTSVRVPFDARRLERRTRRGRRWTGFGLGMAVGAVAGLVSGFASGDDECGEGLFGCLFVQTAGEKATTGAIVLAPIGGLLGALVAGGERYAPLGSVADSRRIVAMVGPDRLGVQIRF